MERDELQKKAVELLFEHYCLILSWSTGVGKSRPAILAIDKLQKNAKILLLVAESLHKNNWKEEFIKAGKESLLKRVTIQCYASMHKCLDEQWDLIIADEVHHIGSRNRLAMLSRMNYQYFMGLSATVSRKLIWNIQDATGRPMHISKIDLQTAIDESILPQPIIKLIPLKLNNTDITEEIIEEWGNQKFRQDYYCQYKDRWNYFRLKKVKYLHARLHIACTQQQKYSFLCEKVNYYKEAYFRSKRENLHNLWLYWGGKRKAFLGEIKTTVVKQWLDNPEIDNKKYICFCTNIEQVEALGGEDAIHSKKSGNNAIVKEFNEDKRKHLFAVGMGVEGINLKGIEAGIIVQLDGEVLKFYQKFGRTTRAKNPIQLIFYYKDTRDEEYLKQILEEINSKYIETVEDKL